jgi:hypothetical protein
MGLAMPIIESALDCGPSPDAERRISSAKLSDLIFVIKRIAGGTLHNDDVQSIAVALSEWDDSLGPISRDALAEKLKAQGRSRQKSLELASSLFAK